MSKIDDGIVENEAKQSEGSAVEEQVSRKAYEEKSRDMHKFKEKAKQRELEINELKANLKSIEESKLREQEQWKELYEREKQEKAKLEENLQQNNQLYIKSVKLSALKAELGNIRDEYLRHANLDSIEVREDGSLSSESVLLVANQFRKDHPLLIPNNNAGNITEHAPSNQVIAEKKSVNVEDMSEAERREYIMSAPIGNKLNN